MKPAHRDGFIASMEQSRRDGTVITLPGAPRTPNRSGTTYGGDPPDDDTLAFMVDPVRCVPDTVNHYFQPVHWSIAAEVPVTYLLNTRDRPVRPEAQERMVTHLPRAPHVVRLDTRYIPAVTDPAGFAQLLASVQ